MQAIVRNFAQSGCLPCLPLQMASKQKRIAQCHALESEEEDEEREMDCYDAIIKIHSVSSCIDRAKIDVLQSAKAHFNITKNTRCRIVAIVGLFDKGKTFLINKLFGKKLPSGKLFSTHGLSFVWVEERRMLILDSAGVQSPVSYHAQNVNSLLDAQVTESFLFEMISRMAHHMICVVNDLTWFEQKYIAMLQQKYVQSKRSIELVVVHNMRTTESLLEAGKLFRQQITSCYEGVQSHLHDLVFTTTGNGNDAPPIHHVGFCKEHSEAGIKYNQKNRDFLIEFLEKKDMLGSEVVLSKWIEAEVGRLLPKFVTIESQHDDTLDNQAITESWHTDEKVRVEYSPASPASSVSGEDFDNRCRDICEWTKQLYSEEESSCNPQEEQPYRWGKIVGASQHTLAGTLEIVKKCPGDKITLKTRGVISPLGEIIAHDICYDPIVNVYDRKDDQHTIYRFIEVECSRVDEEDIELEEISNGVKITVQKRKFIDETKVLPVYPIRQQHGKWEKEFQFEPYEGRFELVDEACGLHNGIFTAVLRKQGENRKVRFMAHWQKPGSGLGSLPVFSFKPKSHQATHQQLLSRDVSISSIMTEDSHVTHTECCQ